MKKNRIAALAATGVAASLVVGSLVIGSNMGFKKNQGLAPAQQDQWLAVPYTGTITNAQDLLNAFGGDGTVTTFIPTNPPTFQFWTGTAGINFPFVPGNGYRFRGGVTVPASVIIVGAHDPNLTVPVGGFIGNRDYLLSPPYHTTWVVAQDILDDVPSGGTVTRIIPGSPPGFEFWTGAAGVNFPYTIGEALTIRPQQASSGFLPSHF